MHGLKGLIKKLDVVNSRDNPCSYDVTKWSKDSIYFQVFDSVLGSQSLPSMSK